MKNNNYICEYHKLDVACLGCIKAWIARHDRMLEFIKKISTGGRRRDYSSYDEGFVDGQNEIADQATNLLNEMGKHDA